MPAVPPLRVALVGNPNAGKTTLFNALSGLRQRTGNYPGVTVEMKVGHWQADGRAVQLIDLPGTYSLSARSPDELVAVELLTGQMPGEAAPDAILAIVDASNLERHLFLVTQLLDLGRPVVVALNMVDVAKSQGITVDATLLSKQLQLPVVPIQANAGTGLDALAKALLCATATPTHKPQLPDEFEREVERLEPFGPAFLIRRALIDIGGAAELRLAKQHGHLPAVLTAARDRLRSAGVALPAAEARARYAWIKTAVAGCIRRPAVRPVTTTDRIDRVLTHPLWGTLVFLLVMATVFLSIFSIAKPVTALIGDGQDYLATFVRGALPAGPLTSLLADGIIKGVGSVIVFLPQIAILFAFIAVLEDCGYMARAAFLMDRLMSRCGLSGMSFIPMLSSVACAVPGVMAARVIENPRDRLATILVAPLMSCSARLPLYTLLVAAFFTEGFPWWMPGLMMMMLYSIGLVVAPLVALLLKRTLLKGETPLFVMEMPAYKRPSVRTVLFRMADRAGAFLYRAGTLILASSVLVWALLYFPAHDAAGHSYEARVTELRDAAEALPKESPERERLDGELNGLIGTWKRGSYLGRVGIAIEPVVRPLGWDWRIGMAALASFPAREVVVSTLGLIYNLGERSSEELHEPLQSALRSATWGDEANGRPVFTVPVALSLLVFFALCCQCASTLAVIRRETKSWFWPAFTFVYMTVLAYAGALVTYQVGRLFG